MAFHTVHPDSAQAIAGALPRPSAAARLFAQFNRAELEGFIAVAIGALDAIDGDPDLEADSEEEEPNGDELDQAWLEWHTMSWRGRRGPNCAGRHEDDEIDDEDCDGFEEEPMFDRRQCENLNSLFGQGAGCPVSDPDHGIEDLPEGTGGLDCGG